MYNPSRSYDNMGMYSQPPQQSYHQSSSKHSSPTSIALFHIPSDAKNSIYVDGIPNDTSEREVNRNFYLL